MRPGRIVLLNGPSSAGKTSIADVLARRFATPWLVLPVDLFHRVRTRPRVDLDQEQWQDAFRRTRSAYHRALAGAAEAGCDVIADHVLSEPWRLAELLQLTGAYDVLLVHVSCDLDELERRERARGDREPGTARSQAEVVFSHGDCDLLVDTTRTSAEDCAAEIERLVTVLPRRTAFDRLRDAGSA